MVHLVVPCQARGTASSAVFQEDNPPQTLSTLQPVWARLSARPVQWWWMHPQLQECLILYVKHLFIHLFRSFGCCGWTQSCSKQRVFTRPQVWMPS